MEHVQAFTLAPTLGSQAGHGLGLQPIPARVLVGDDDPRNLFAVAEMLQGAGVEVVLANSGEEVLLHVLKDDFAVILLDVRMPRIDGYEVASMIRGRPRSSRTPIIFLTAYNKDELHVFRGYSAGAVDYVFKPIEPLILKSKVDVFVDLYRKTEEIRRQAAHERQLLLENLKVRSEKQQAEQALLRREEHQSLILQALPIALYTAPVGDDARRLKFTSDSVERITGFAPGEFVDQPDFWVSRLHAEDRDRVLAQLRTVEETGAATLEYRWHSADGSERHLLDQVVLMREPDGRAREIFGMWFDITERKHLEQNLLHASKLEAIGRLTGGIAHDFNNMLGVIIGSLDLLDKQLGKNNAARRRVAMAMEGARSCADLTHRLLAFSRRQSLQATVVDLRSVMTAMVEILRRTIGDRIETRLEMEDGLWPVLVDRSQLESALLNLAVNARDAMPEGGRLTIAIANRTAEGDQERAADSVEIAVSDTGVGMSPETLERVFEPFFTTKEIGKGTGLGLSMIYGFVQQSGGHISIDSAVGSGTTVRIRLPRTDLAQEEIQAGDAVDPGALASGRGEVILVVEDDLKVRNVTVSTIEAMGYAVRQAENAAAALEILAAEEEIDLVFSDISMPGRLTGADLAREARRQRPGLPVLLTSGHADSAGLVEGVEVLPKPYRASVLAEKLRSMLGQVRASAVRQADLTPG
jgi:PAS domain S-box-containing protein